MSYDDDDMIEDDDYYDDDVDDLDDDDEEVGSGRSSVNPFATGGSSGLPGRTRSGLPSSAFGSRPGGQGDASPGNRDSSRENLSSRLAGSPLGKSGSGNPPPRDAKDVASDRSRFFGSQSASPGGGGGGGGNQQGNRFGVRSPGGDRPNSPSSPSSGGSSGGGSSPFSSRPSSPGGDRPSSPSSGGGGGGASFGSRPSTPGGSGGRPADDKPSGGEKSGNPLSNLTSRLPFGKKGDDKPGASREGGGRFGGGGGSRPGAGGEKSGNPLSALTSRLPFGKKGDDSGTPARKPPSAQAGGGKSGNPLSALTSRLPFGKKGDNAAPKADAGRSAFGGGASSGGGGGASQFGRDRGAAAAPSREKSGGGGGGLFSKLRLPFGGGDDKKAAPKTSKTRASKIPHATEEGLSLDTKLDILGVGLVFGALVLFLSSLSGEQGAITGAINEFFGQLLGWGAVAVPVVMMAIGGWLIFRHFGEEAPEIDPVRVAGLVITYVGVLMVLMFFETFSPHYTTPEAFPYAVQISVQNGRGGGLVGAELYTLLVTNVGEISAFFAMLGWLVVGIMLTTRTSAAELAVFVISIWRSFQVAVQHRAQKRRAMRLEAEQARAAQQPQISISKPAAAELPAGVSAALPAPAEDEVPGMIPIEERAIPIRMGGQMVGAPAESAQALPGQTAPAGAPASPAATAEGERSGGLIGGFASRLRSAVPAALPFGSKPSDDDDDIDDDEEILPARAAPTAPATGARPSSPGDLFGRRSGASGLANAQSERPAGAPPVPSIPQTTPQQPPAQQPAASAQPATPPPTQQPTRPGTSPFAPTPPPSSAPGERPAAPPSAGSRLSQRPFGADDTDQPASDRPTPFSRPTAPAASQPPLTPAPEKAAAETPPEDDMLSRLPPAQPKGLGPVPRPQPSSSFASRFGQSRPELGRKPEADDEIEDEDETETEEQPEALSGSLTDRLSRLNAIRSGQSARPASPFASRPVLDEDEDEEDEDFDEIDEIEDDESLDEDDTIDDVVEDEEDKVDEIDDEEVAVSPASRLSPFAATPPPAAPSGESRPLSAFRKPEETPSTPAPDTSRPAAFKLPSADAATPPSPAETPRPQPTTPTPAPRQTEPVINPPRPMTAPQPAAMRSQKQWRLPDYRTLLASGSEQDFDRDSLVKRARIIEETLQSFGAPGRVVEINTGPVITQFGVEPDYLTVRGGKKNRVKVSAIAQLDKDLQLALGAKSIRIEAPVPGKGFVGVEVPNEEASLVSLRDVMESRQFNKIKSPLAIALGQSVDGTPIAADLSVMPHLLIAGTTGSGKSVCVNSIIASLLVRNTPEHVKLIMVDPKRVELTGYNGIPHLIAPVVVELERIVGVLKWVTREMDERYKRFSNAGARNIEDYNQHLPPGEEIMPFIVVIIDELADLMMLAPDETERVITRIAALARATGIHLVIATQRPSVDVVTGLIKANFPARVAFAVASSVDSRVILDQPGADRLLGRGDMLYMSPDSPAPLRLQGVFVSDMEINNINRYWKAQQTDAGQQRPITALVMDSSPTAESRSVMPRGDRFMQPPPASTQRAFWDKEASSAAETSSSADRSNGDHEDELYDEAVELVRRLNKASVSLLQRRLRIGYTRAARLIDVMEAEGIVGPATEGSKPREVLPARK